MTQSFFIVGTLPGANQCLWKHWRTFREIKIGHQIFIKAAIRRAKIKKMEYAAVRFDWREPNQKRDFDNIMFAQKFILDALVQQKILKDDGWAHITKIEHSVALDASQPGVLVSLEGM
jgi:Holliday junction resolvase RusA-like endonuclease